MKNSGCVISEKCIHYPVPSATLEAIGSQSGERLQRSSPTEDGRVPRRHS